MSILAKPEQIYNRLTYNPAMPGPPFGPGPLPTVVQDVGNAATFVLVWHGGTGVAYINQTTGLVSGSPSDWQPLAYSFTVDGPTQTGPINFSDGTRIYASGPISWIQIEGTVTSGLVNLSYFGSPFVFGNDPVFIDMAADLDKIATAIASLNGAPTETILVHRDGDDVSGLEPLPVSLIGSASVTPTPNMAFPVSDIPLQVFAAPGTVQNAAATYAATYAVGLQFQIQGLVRQGINTGYLRGAVISDQQGQSAQLFLLLFNAQPSAATDQNTWNPSASDRAKYIGMISFGDSVSPWYSTGTGTSCTWQGKDIPLNLPNNGTLWCQLVANGAPVWSTANQLSIMFQSSAN